VVRPVADRRQADQAEDRHRQGERRRSRSDPQGGRTGATAAHRERNPISEFAPDGTRTFKLSFDADLLPRHPVLFGQLGRADLRAGMDAQHPR